MDFIKPKYDGKRFDDHQLPSDIAKDIPVYREFLLEVAKVLYLHENDDKTRAPRGFGQFDVKLAGVLEGSAALDLRFHHASDDTKITQCYERASREIMAVVDSASTGQIVLPDWFPSHLLRKFDKLGRHLKDGEVILFPKSGTNNIARYDQKVRRKLVNQVGMEITEEFEYFCRFVEYNSENKNLTIRLDNGETAAGEVAEEYITNEVLLSLKNRNEYFEIQGEASYNSQGRLIRIVEITGIEQFDKEIALKSITHRFVELQSLNDLPKIDASDMDAAQSIIRSLVKDHCFDAPVLGVTDDSELQVEWKIGNFSLDLQFNFESREAYLLATRVGTLDSTETVFRFMEEQEIPRLIQALLKYDSRRGWQLDD